MTVNSDALDLSEVREPGGVPGTLLDITGRPAGTGAHRAQLFRVTPVVLEAWVDGEVLRIECGYDRVLRSTDAAVGYFSVRFPHGGAVHLEDRWQRTPEGRLRVARQLEASADTSLVHARCELWLGCRELGDGTFTSMRYLSPTLLYDRNDINEDGLEDWLLADAVVARDDRIANRAFLAFDETRGYGVTLRRVDQPVLDEAPYERASDDAVVAITDVGSLGIEHSGESMRLVGCYPFAERPHSWSVTTEGRPGWRALRPMHGGDTVSWEYELAWRSHDSFHDAFWTMFRDVAVELAPVPAAPRTDPAEVCRLRLDSAARYFVEGIRANGNAFAGTALNCHPQDGVPLGRIIQLGFTGQSVLLAHDWLRAAELWNDTAMRERAQKAVDFMATEAQMGNGLLWGLYNVDRDRFQSWWGGLILPLAYGDDEQVRKLMGPLRDHLAPVINVLSRTEGSYLRGLSEENEALIRSYEFEKAHGREHPRWLEAARAFGDFLVGAQTEQGAWYRAYQSDGRPLTEPTIWFGTTPAELGCSTGMPIPFLTKLSQVTGDRSYLDAAVRAGQFVASELIGPVRWSGGIHDSIYGKGMLVDNESVLFCMEGLESLWQATGDERWRSAALLAAKYCGSWVYLWDVPLPTGSTLERFRLRTTGMGACDTCAAGSFVHPFLLRGLPTMLEIGLREREELLVDLSELVFWGCSQTVALWEGDWGYAVPGLQEEGYLISSWLVDDPMFHETGFGGRGIGEGNKTALSWINASGAFAYLELQERFGTADVGEIRRRAGVPSLLGLDRLSRNAGGVVAVDDAS